MKFQQDGMDKYHLAPHILASCCSLPRRSLHWASSLALVLSEIPPSVLPLTVFAIFQTLKVAVDAILPGIDSNVAAGSTGSVAPLLTELTEALNTAITSLASLSPGDAGAANQDITTLVTSTLDSVNTALGKVVPKLDIDGLLTPLDGGLTGLLTTLGGILPPVSAFVGGILIPVGGQVGSLLSGLGLAAL